VAFAIPADNREVLEYDSAADAIQRWYAHGLGPDAVLNEIDGARTSSPRETLLPDTQGSVIGTLASVGTSTKIGYRSYGETIAREVGC